MFHIGVKSCSSDGRVMSKVIHPQKTFMIFVLILDQSFGLLSNKLSAKDWPNAWALSSSIIWVTSCSLHHWVSFSHKSTFNDSSSSFNVVLTGCFLYFSGMPERDIEFKLNRIELNSSVRFMSVIISVNCNKRLYSQLDIYTSEFLLPQI